MILHAPPCAPALGPARRHLHLFEEISRRHAVSIITLGSAADRQQFEREHAGRYERAVFVSKRPRLVEMLVGFWYLVTLRCVFRRLYLRPLQRAIDRAIARGRFDAVYCSTLLLGYYRVPPGIRVVGDAHNVEYEVLARAAAIARNPLQKTYFHLQARVTRRDEEQLARQFSEVWATSARDAERFALARGDRRVAVVPNGVRCQTASDSFRAFQTMTDTERRPPVLLFVGLMSYLPNGDAVNYFLDRVFPLITARLPGVRLLVVGAAPPRRIKARGAEQVTIVGRVPSVEPYFRQASAFVVPLRCGGGTRVKVLEAMLHGVPVVSTTLGCEGLAVRDGESVLLADTPETFAASVVRVCSDAALARRLAAAGADLVHAEYDWRRIGESVDGLLSQTAFA
jgi:glycosyltransferase involved in cell wall biosynthesis